MALTVKMRKAANNYLKGMTKQDAMLAAGYSESMAKTRTQDVFDHPEVVAIIEKSQKLAATRANVDLDWIVERLRQIANASLGDIIEVDEDGTVRHNMKNLNADLRRALSGLDIIEYTEGRGKDAKPVRKYKVRVHDQLRALELLVRHLGLSKEKITVEVKDDLAERLYAGRERAGLDND